MMYSWTQIPRPVSLALNRGVPGVSSRNIPHWHPLLFVAVWADVAHNPDPGHVVHVEDQGTVGGGGEGEKGQRFRVS